MSFADRPLLIILQMTSQQALLFFYQTSTSNEWIILIVADDTFIYIFISFIAIFAVDLTFICFWLQYLKMMRWSQSKPRLQLVKQWLFQFFFTLDISQFTNQYALLFNIVAQLTVLHYFYINPAFSFLNSHNIFQLYFQNIRQYFVHVYAFNSSILALFTLAIYPLIILMAIVVKRFGPNKILTPIMQISVFLYPLLWVKVMIQLVSALKLGQFLYFVVPLGIVNLAFGAILLILTKRTYRMMEFPLVLFLELYANMYLTLVALLIRLVILAYILRSANRNSLGFYFEASLMTVLLASPFCDDQFLNNVGLFTFFLACLATGANETRRAFQNEKSILHFADLLQEEDEEEAVFEVYQRVEAHHIDCDLTDCLCQHFYEVKHSQLAEWVYKFQEQRLRRVESLQGRLEYAERCWSHYDYKLSGLVRVCDRKPQGIIEEYLIFKACCIYELNLRKQDKNYRYGESYKNSQEELQTFHKQLADILAEIKKFWSLITSFDGSTKFLNQILLISHAITKLRDQYQIYQSKYDEQMKQFKYAYQLFLSIILNEQIAEQDEILVPDSSAFLITNGQTILNANNAFLILTAQTLDNIVGHPYNFLVPDVYKDIHKKWAIDFIEQVEEYEGKAIPKCLSIGSMEIKMVEMEHKVLPRFLDGLQIFTIIRMNTQNKKEKRDNFIFLVQKETFYIKNVQSTFFDTIKFKINQRNFKLLQQMSLTSIFQNFTINLADNPTRQVAIFPHFLQEFTYTKSKRKTAKAKGKVPSSRPSNIMSYNTKAITDTDQIFQFTILPSNRPQDPYSKVRFTLKQQKTQQAESSQDSNSRYNEPQQSSSHQKQKKQDSFNFTIPYFLLLTLAICHIFYALGRQSFDIAMADLQNRYTFYVDFDYTTLKVLSAETGIDHTEQLRALWIQGYGDFSQSFNAFRRVTDPYFLNYFNSEITTNFHNQLFIQIQAKHMNAISTINSYKIFAMITLIMTISYYVADLFLSLRYTFFIESKVGALLLQFVIIQSADVKEIMAMIQSFQASILNNQDIPSAFKVPMQVGEQSAFELMKGGGYSLNNSMVAPYDQEGETPKEHSQQGRKRLNSGERQRSSLLLIKNQFKNAERSAFKKSSVLRQDSKEDKNRNINLFKRRYRSCGFIISANKWLFFLIFSGFIISITILFISFLYLYSPFNYLPLHLQTLDSLEQVRIILLKSQTEILINSPTLQPDTTLSSTLLSLISLISSLSAGPMSSFSSTFSTFMNTDVCQQTTFNCSLLSNDNNIHQYGIKVISQYLQNYFRQQNTTLLTSNTIQNKLIIYTQILFTQLINQFVISSNQYCNLIDGSQLRMVIIGSLALLAGMILTHYSLREFKDRIQNSRNLLQIIPKEIKKKQEKEIDQLTLKELSTP